MPYATAADGAPLYYEVHDYTDPWTDAPTIILLHGFGRSGKFWFSLIPYLSRFYRVICPDQRGLGRSVPLENALERVTAETCMADVVSVADHAGVDRFHLVGESGSGTIAMAFAVAYPDRLRTLCLLAPGVWVGEGTWTWKSYALEYGSWEEAIRALGVEGWVRKSNTLARFPAETDPQFLEWYTKEVGKSELEAAVGMIRIVATLDGRPLLERITAPVLALYPRAGQISTPGMRELLRSRIPRVWVKTVPTAYQMLALLKPAECAQEILAFASLHDGVVPRE